MHKKRRLTRAPYRRPRAPASGAEIDLYVDEAVTRSMVESVIAEVRDLRQVLMNFLFVVIGSVVIDIVIRAWGR
jgi:hypothetical protein